MAPWRLPHQLSVQSKESSTQEPATSRATSKFTGMSPSGQVSSVWDSTTYAILLGSNRHVHSDSAPVSGLQDPLSLKLLRSVWWVSRKCRLCHIPIWHSRGAYSYLRSRRNFSPIIIFSPISFTLSFREELQGGDNEENETAWLPELLLSLGVTWPWKCVSPSWNSCSFPRQ